MNEFSKQILNWYTNNKRDMPWRDVKDPYKVWVSEIMLQQTRVDTVTGYYKRWMERFPDLSALATADQTEVLRYWEGLGYYSRARKLLDAARIVTTDLGGKIPTEPADLIRLPGVGAYTAAAIASFAFNADTFPVDGNINRVFARVFGIEAMLGGKEFAAEIESKRVEVFPNGRSADFNQGLMDLGAMICKPTNPVCDQCPVKHLCASVADPERLPARAEKKTVPTVAKIAAAMYHDGEVFITQRDENGLLGGLWEFPSVEIENDHEPTSRIDRLAAQMGIPLPVGDDLLVIRHAYTHFKVVENARLFVIERPPALSIEGRWVNISQLKNLPMGKIDRAIADRLEALFSAD